MYDKQRVDQTKRIIITNVSSYDVAVQMRWPVSRYGRMDYCPICKGTGNHSGSGGFIVYKGEADSYGRHDGGFYCHYKHHGGNVIDLVMQVTGLTFFEALKWFDTTFGLNLPEIPKESGHVAEQITKEQRMRNAFLVLYEGFIKLVHKIMADGQTEHLEEAENCLDRVKSIIEQLS